VSDWREGFYAAVARWLRDREPNLDIARVVAVDEDIDITNGYSIANDELEVSVEIRYADSSGVLHTHSRTGRLGDVIREITAGESAS
jgi:hypothetical protein